MNFLRTAVNRIVDTVARIYNSITNTIVDTIIPEQEIEEIERREEELQKRIKDEEKKRIKERVELTQKNKLLEQKARKLKEKLLNEQKLREEEKRKNKNELEKLLKKRKTEQIRNELKAKLQITKTTREIVNKLPTINDDIDYLRLIWINIPYDIISIQEYLGRFVPMVDEIKNNLENIKYLLPIEYSNSIAKVNTLKIPKFKDFDERGDPIKDTPIVLDLTRKDKKGTIWTSNRFREYVYLYDNVMNIDQLYHIMAYEYRKLETISKNNSLVSVFLRFIDPEDDRESSLLFRINPKFITSLFGDNDKEKKLWSLKTLLYALDLSNKQNIVDNKMFIRYIPDDQDELLQKDIDENYLSDLKLNEAESDAIPVDYKIDLSYFKFLIDRALPSEETESKSEIMVYETHNIESNGFCGQECFKIVGIEFKEAVKLNLKDIIEIIIRCRLNIAIFENKITLKKYSKFENNKIKYSDIKSEFIYIPPTGEIDHYFCYDGEHIDVVKVDEKNQPLISPDIEFDENENTMKKDVLIHKRIYDNDEEKEIVRNFSGLNIKYCTFNIVCVDDIYVSNRNVPIIMTINIDGQTINFMGSNCIKDFFDWLHEYTKVVFNPFRIVFIGYDNSSLENLILYNYITNTTDRRFFIIYPMVIGNSIWNMHINGKHSFWDLKKHLTVQFKDLCKTYDVNYMPIREIMNKLQILYNSNKEGGSLESRITTLINEKYIERVKLMSEYRTKSIRTFYDGYKKCFTETPYLSKYANELTKFVSISQLGWDIEMTYIKTIDCNKLGLKSFKKSGIKTTQEEQDEQARLGKRVTKTKTANEFGFTKMPEEWLKKLYNNVVGARTQLFNGSTTTEENIIGCDESSAYIHIMAVDNNTFGCGKEFIHTTEFQEDYNGYYTINVDQTNLTEQGLPMLYPKKLRNGKHTYHHNDILYNITVSSSYIKAFRELGCKVQIIEGIYLPEHISTTELFKPMLEIDRLKNSTTDPVMKKVYKLLALSIPGKVSQKLKYNKTVYFHSHSRYNNFLNSNGDKINFVQCSGNSVLVNLKSNIDPTTSKQKPYYIGVDKYARHNIYMYMNVFRIIKPTRLISTVVDCFTTYENDFKEWVNTVGNQPISHTELAAQYDPRYLTATLFDENKNKICGSFNIEYKNVENSKSFFLANGVSLVQTKNGWRTRLSGVDQEKSILLEDNDDIGPNNSNKKMSDFFIHNQHRLIFKNPLPFFEKMSENKIITIITQQTTKLLPTKRLQIQKEPDSFSLRTTYILKQFNKLDINHEMKMLILENKEELQKLIKRVLNKEIEELATD